MIFPKIVYSLHTYGKVTMIIYVAAYFALLIIAGYVHYKIHSH